jgi:KaiC/GvpD/RAD55 family RecA-like ATPase
MLSLEKRGPINEVLGVFRDMGQNHQLQILALLGMDLTSNKNFDVVFCSDLKRAIDSAKLGFGNKYKISEDIRLRECNYGDWNGNPTEFKDGKMDQYITTTFPNGESYSDVEKRLSDIARSCIKTGWELVDNLLDGGLAPGELGVIISSAGGGKSWCLARLGAEAMMQGKNVIHYTLELNENYVGRRYDACFTGFDFQAIPKQKEIVKKRVDDMKSQPGMGKLKVKYCPIKTVSAMSLKSHLERCQMIEGIKYDMMVVDYADILRSTRQYDAKRFELQLIYQELRAYASEINVPIWTASQSNKEGAGADVVDLNNMSEAYGKAMEADVVISLSRKSHEKSLGVGRLFIAKNRAGKDGMVYAMKINTARSTFSLLDTYENQEQKSSSDFQADDDSVRNKLRLRMKELRDEDELKGLSPQ